MLPTMDSILTHLDRFAPDDLPDDSRRLQWLALSFMEVTLSVERIGEPDESGAFASGRVIIER
jgi:hypothetical protein